MYGKATPGLEPKVMDALKKTERWWTKWIMIPLETVPLPLTLTQGPRNTWIFSGPLQ